MPFEAAAAVVWAERSFVPRAISVSPAKASGRERIKHDILSPGTIRIDSFRRPDAAVDKRRYVRFFIRTKREHHMPAERILHLNRLQKPSPTVSGGTARSIDPGPLLGSGFHELLGAGTGAEATVLAFAISAVARAAARADRGLCFCSFAADAQEDGAPYGYGLGDLGVAPGKLLMVCADKEKHLLWTLEEALASKAFGAVIGALGSSERLYGFPESRRLKLRVMESETPLYLLRHDSRGGATAAHGRWRIAPAPSQGDGRHGLFTLPGPTRLRLTLEKLGGLPPQQWEMEYDGTRGFRMAALLPDPADRAADAGRRQAV